MGIMYGCARGLQWGHSGMRERQNQATVGVDCGRTAARLRTESRAGR